MLFERKDIKKIIEISERVADGNKSLSAQDIVAIDSFYSSVKIGVEVKVAEIANAFYPLTKRKFFELKDFCVVDDMVNVACYDLDVNVFTFSFPIRMFNMSKKEIENHTLDLCRRQLRNKKRELEEKEKEVEMLKQKISDLETACQTKEY